MVATPTVLGMEVREPEQDFSPVSKELKVE